MFLFFLAVTRSKPFAIVHYNTTSRSSIDIPPSRRQSHSPRSHRLCVVTLLKTTMALPLLTELSSCVRSTEINLFNSDVVKSLPSLWDQRWERRSWRPEQTQCRSKNKDIEVGRQNLMVANRSVMQTNKHAKNIIYIFTTRLVR